MMQFYFWSIVAIASALLAFWKIKIKHDFWVYATYAAGIVGISYLVFLT